MYDNSYFRRDGTATISATAPDTITEWITSAFAVHPRSGLGVATELANLSVSYIDISYNPFVQLSLIINNKLNDHNKLRKTFIISSLFLM